MSKEEEFIRDYTKRCSNELTYGGFHEWLTPENALAAVELAREEMKEQMIKDAIETTIDGKVVKVIVIDE